MASRVVMPKLSDTMEEGRILRWLRRKGDPIETGQALAEVETDKATVEMEAYTSGTILELVAEEGQFARIGDLIAVIGSPGEDISALLAAAAPAAPPAAAPPAGSPAPAPPPRTAAPAEAVPPAATADSRAGTAASPVGRALKASPLAIRMAAESGLDLSTVRGSGPQGRIIKRDIEAAMAAPAAGPFPRAFVPPAGQGPEVRDVVLSTVRRTIAKRLVQSKGPVPHFYLTVDIEMDRAWSAYRAIRDRKLPISINDIVVKASALALRRHPELNASFAGDHVKQYSRVHIGIAVALDDGLVTPVLRDADLKPLEVISEEARALAERARARKLQPDEYTGATFSISNLGMMGIEEFSAIINPPEAAILAVGAVRQVPVVVDGAVGTGWRMKLTLSVDHRVADGAAGARFLQTLRTFLEHPLLMA
ncbi:MAG TPA: dihydrolipoamide acetyltransferase family protein [Vicinamibacterales bacterium]|nr:dihydrolipoamide acetyltransferase family protein [Vicinamibacterales bacterium]